MEAATNNRLMTIESPQNQDQTQTPTQREQHQNSELTTETTTLYPPLDRTATKAMGCMCMWGGGGKKEGKDQKLIQ